MFANGLWRLKLKREQLPFEFPPDGVRSAVKRTAFCHNKTLAAAMTASVLYSTCRHLCALHQCPSPLIHVFIEHVRMFACVYLA